ncbi:glycosyltransferase 87 family protein [Novosphingobium kunmingense]|uniref:glycosyltransferase 87 family protein n=1 Tax=Novosphingobium kunmingense TaxID=1211806 RepID=UPI0018E2273D|nr:glycosyltransferase 87 family protein [Novosphingobium kunmingense]
MLVQAVCRVTKIPEGKCPVLRGDDVGATVMTQSKYTGIKFARLVGLVLLGSTAANLCYNAIMAALGYGWPYNFMLFDPIDRFADFFKLAFSYGSTDIHATFVTGQQAEQLAVYMHKSQHNLGTIVNPDHMLPVATAMAIIVRKLMGLVDPFIVFSVCTAVALLSLVATFQSYVTNDKERMYWLLGAIASYPLMFAIDRGHLIALVCAIALIAGARHLFDARRLTWPAAAALSFAVCIRPNLLSIPVLLITLLSPTKIRDLVIFFATCLLLFILSMTISHALFPHYSFETWLMGLADYHRRYVALPINLGYVSSLTSVFMIHSGYNPLVERACFALGALIGILAMHACFKNKMPSSHAAFIAIGLTFIATPALNDYHLLPFFIPLLFLSREGGPENHVDWIIVFSSLFALSPKNYFFGNDNSADAWSWQVICNPIVISIATIWVLMHHLRTPRTDRSIVGTAISQ